MSNDLNSFNNYRWHCYIKAQNQRELTKMEAHLAWQEYKAQEKQPIAWQEYAYGFGFFIGLPILATVMFSLPFLACALRAINGGN